MTFFDIRPAPGTKFLYVVDSYIYAVIKAGGADDVINADKGIVWLVTGDLGELIGSCAREQGVKESQLGLTPDELDFLRHNTGVVMLENETGNVDAEYFTDQYDAIRHFHEYHMAEEIRVSTLTVQHTPGLHLVTEDDV
jgi:hypothetical protein